MGYLFDRAFYEHTLISMSDAQDQPNPQDGTIKIAIPMAEGKFCEHFGGAKEFLIFEGNPSSGILMGNTLLPAPEHKPGSLPTWLAAQQVDMLVASAIGERALLMLADSGISTFLSNGAADPSEIAQACLRGSLPRANTENSRCHGAHHDGHDCHH